MVVDVAVSLAVTVSQSVLNPFSSHSLCTQFTTVDTRVSPVKRSVSSSGGRVTEKVVERVTYTEEVGYSTPSQH